MNHHFLHDVDASWSLFLDRDGVINQRKIGGYIEYVEEFQFLPGVLEALYMLNEQFNRIVVVTNQQGIGKNLMSFDQLDLIHNHMLSKIEEAHGRIDNIYSCPDLHDENAYCRKPNPGMAYQAQQDFPDIQFHKCIMVGDSITDMMFAKKLGMKSVFVVDSKMTGNEEMIDLKVQSLLQFAKLVTANK